MRPFLVTLLALTVSCTPPQASTCDATDTLRAAAEAYRRTTVLSDRWQGEFQVPGAPLKTEIVEYGYAGDVTTLRMPRLYVIRASGARLTVADDVPVPGKFVDRPVSGGLQNAIDEAFGGQGGPLVPTALLLRAAQTDQERLDAFRFRILRNVRPDGCVRTAAGDEVTLRADNGVVRALFGPAGFLQRISGEIETGPGQPPITARVSFSPRMHRPADSIDPGTLRGARAVSTVAELSASPRLKALPAARELATLDGRSLRLSDLRGSVVVLEFFATWCGPCRLTVPAVAKFARSHPRVVVLLVNTQERATPERVRTWLREAGAEQTTLLDPDGELHRQLGGGLPLTVVVAADGSIVETLGGFDPAVARSLHERVGKLLPERD